MRVMLRGHADTQSGYGRDFVDLCVALSKVVEVHVRPMTVMPPLPPEFLSLLSYPCEQRPDAEVIYAPPHTMLDWTPRQSSRRVLWSMWERSPIPEALLVEWGWLNGLGAPTIEAEDFDGLWVPSQTAREAFAPLELATRLLCTGVDIDVWMPPPHGRYRDGRPGVDRPLRVLSLGDGPRKNHEAVIGGVELVNMRRRGAVELVVKDGPRSTLHPDRMPPEARLLARALPTEGVRDLYWAADLFVSASRGEGINKPALEMMATGGAVALSACSAHLDHVRDGDTGLLIGGQSGIAHDGSTEFVVRPEGVADALLRVLDTPALLPRIAAAGHAWVCAARSWPVVAASVIRYLNDLAR